MDLRGKSTSCREEGRCKGAMVEHVCCTLRIPRRYSPCVGPTELGNEWTKGHGVRERRAGSRITGQIAKKKTTVRT